jgi:hypothetical protein
LLPVFALLNIFIAITLLIDFFSHIIIKETYTDTIWQYILITFVSLFYIYGAILMYKNKKNKLYQIVIGIIAWIFITYIFFNRETIVILHLLADKKPYILKTQITKVLYEHTMIRGAWEVIKIKNYNQPFNTVSVFKGNRHLKLHTGQEIYIHGLKSKFGFTYLDFQYPKNNKYLKEISGN